MTKTSKKAFTFASGKRKTSVARVRLIAGKQECQINGDSLSKYFPGENNKLAFLKPLFLTKTQDKYYVTIRVLGGGKESQLDACVQGIAKALVTKSSEYRTILRKMGLLTRDPRTRERRKVGTGGRARRQKQSPKR